MNLSPRGHPSQIYREQQIPALGPGRLVLLALEMAVRACREGRRGLLTRVLEELAAGLDLDQGEIAAGLLRLYEYLLRATREGNLEEVETVLADLHASWETAVRTEEGRAASAQGSWPPS